MKNLLHDALEDLKGHLLEAPVYESVSDNRNRWKRGELTRNETSVNLRLDWELADDTEATAARVLDLMMMQVENDISDLIENGDVDNHTDPLLKAFNGIKKRGQQPVEIEFIGVHLYKEHKEKKKFVEFTLFLRPYIRWEE